MQDQTIGAPPAAEPVSEADANEVLRRNERLFEAADVEAILDGFSKDVAVRFAEVPEFRGIEALERFLRARFARQVEYKLRKTLRATGPGVIVASWEGIWRDGATGAPMRGRGMEILSMRGGVCVEWDATFNTWAEGAEAPVAFL